MLLTWIVLFIDIFKTIMLYLSTATDRNAGRGVKRQYSFNVHI